MRIGAASSDSGEDAMDEKAKDCRIISFGAQILWFHCF